MYTVDQLRLVDWFFDTKHPETAKDDHNMALIAAFLREKTGGDQISSASLEFAVQSLQGQLHILAGVDVTDQLAAGAEAQQRLAEELAEKNRKDEIARKEAEFFARQDARREGVSSAFKDENSSDAAADRQERIRRAELNKKNAVLAQRHQRFTAELRFANQILEVTATGLVSWAQTYDKRNAAKRLIISRFPQFKNEVEFSG